MISWKENRINFLIFLGIYITIFVNSLVLFKDPLDFYIGYLIMILLLPVFFFRYKLPTTILLVFTILLLVGVWNIIGGKADPADFIKVFAGTFMSYLFYYYVFQEYNHNVRKLFEYYLYGCYIVSIIGLIQFVSYKIGFVSGYNFKWILNKWGYVEGGNFGIRVNSIFGEPSQAAEVLSTAVFVAFYDLFQKEPFYFKDKKKALLIIGIFIMTVSSTGYIAFFLTLLLLFINFGLIRYLLIAIPVLYGFFLVIYNYIPEFKERYDSQVRVYTTGDFAIGKDHGSTIIQYNNFHVASENMKENTLFGTGLGSHPTAFEKYSLTKHIEVHGFDLNSKDANSMLYRLMSETGLFGLGIMLFIILRFYVSRYRENNDHENPYWLISNAILVMIAVKLVRQGHYFLNGFPFFIIMYYYSWVKNKEKVEEYRNSQKLEIEH